MILQAQQTQTVVPENIPPDASQCENARQSGQTMAEAFLCSGSSPSCPIYCLVDTWCANGQPQYPSGMSFDTDPNKWDVRAVTEFGWLFATYNTVNCSGGSTGGISQLNISEWRTTAATGMSRMFYNTNGFNSPLKSVTEPTAWLQEFSAGYSK